MVMEQNYDINIADICTALNIPTNFDIVKRSINLGNKKATLFFIDGMIKDGVMQRILTALMSITPEQMSKTQSADHFAMEYLPYVEVECSSEVTKMTTGVFSGAVLFVIEDYNKALIIDLRTFPVRSVTEPESDKVLRGSHDGFTETLMFNTALIRRRIRSEDFTMEILTVGKSSKSDVAICYMGSRVDKHLLNHIKTHIQSLEIDALCLNQESLIESLITKKWYNPFPKARFTERPDSASASILEGKILIMVDNTPSTIILPTSLFDFFQETNDFYFPPFAGTYLRISRLIMLLSTLLLTPIWLLIIKNPDIMPEWIAFLKIAEPNTLPLILQLLLVEFAIDALQLASLNTPSALGNSLSVISALILGEFAVKSGWIVSEVILYMAIVAIGSFSQNSYELGYAIKFCRISLLLLVSFLGVYGLIFGILFILFALYKTKTVANKSYLYPIIPFNKELAVNIFFRKPKSWSDSPNKQ